MFKRILVPLDGSDLAERSLPVAARIAGATGGSVILFGVATTPVDFSPYVTPSHEYAEKVVQNDLRRVKEYLQEVAHSPALAGLKVETYEVFEAVAPAIMSAAQEHHADLVVMSSHGYTGMKRWAIGSVAQKVARHCPIPVLVLRADGSSLIGEHPLRALVSLDGSPLAEAAVEAALQFVTALSGSAQGELHLLRVINVPSTSGKFRSQAYIDFDADIRAQEKQEAQTYLDAVANRLRQSTQENVLITASIVVHADIATAIIHAAEQSDILDGKPYDLIAMATHGRGGISRWTLGSITERVLGATRLPLLIVRPQEMYEELKPTHKGVKEGDLQPWSGLL